LLSAAKRLEPHDVRLARATHLEALATASFRGGPGADRDVQEAAEAAFAAPPAPWPPRAVDLLLDGLAVRFTDGFAAAAPALKRALRTARLDDVRETGDILWTWLTCRVAMEMWDDETLDVLAAREIQLARDTGVLTELPTARCFHATSQLLAGDFAAAAAAIDEAHALTPQIGISPLPSTSVMLTAWQGDEARASSTIAACAADAIARGDGRASIAAEYATALLFNGLGRYEDALAAAQRAGEDPYELLVSTWAAVELVEAGARSGARGVAAAALERLSETTRASGTDWALGIEVFARALLSDGEPAERLYREAIDRLGRTRVRVALARAHLLYGEWLRRGRRRTDAREQLRTAYEMFVTMGAEGFAERAERELLATGETARKRAVETRDELTSQEGQIARLARDGLSNPEIGARLFISPRTVQYHLRKVFLKLGINSRGQLDRVLPSDPGVA
jgi:DNA-binding CsgD family transcriptional regulator